MEFALEMKSITKEFPGVKALNNVTFRVKRGEIHALCGENGAGKSTLMKTLSGLYPKGSYQGQIIIDGKERTFDQIKDSEEAGVAIIYQELALAKNITVAENMFLGNEIKNKFGIIDWAQLNYISEKWLKEVGLGSVRSYQITGFLGIGQQQLVEIAKALSKKANILILDEPTAALTEQEVEILTGILKELRKRGVTCIYISHKLNEVLDIADTVTVLRDGETIATHPAEELTEQKIVSLMVGRELKERYPHLHNESGDVLMSVNNFSVWNSSKKKVVDNVSFEIKAGQILGISGLVGAGRTELVMSLFGAFEGESIGTVKINGSEVKLNSTEEAIKHKLALVSEDRKKYGLILNETIQKNISLSSLSEISVNGVVNGNSEVHHANNFMKSLKIKANSIETITGNLSGGNQQKVVLAKCLMTNPNILFLDEPTRGIDVAAKYEIYNIMNELIRNGVAIIMVSSELPEILGMSHRILVMSEGKIAGEFSREEATQEKIMAVATGGK